MLDILDRDRSIAKPGFNRWLVPPAALSIHLCIGQIYAFSVFNDPMTRLIGIDASTAGDWNYRTLGWIFSIALFCLGASAAVFGKWVERSGPRKSMLVSAFLFSGGFFVSALGIWLHSIWLIYFGYGVLGGIGLGIGYISPVSTLIKWFPDRPGMATGMAIMGFGGGAMVASPLSVWLMDYFKTESSTGVMEAFMAMGLLYFVFIMFGVVTVRVPAEGWKPEGFDRKKRKKRILVTDANVTADNAVRTPQFYLLFAVLMLNVTAGMGVLGQASVMIQEMFSSEAVGANAAVSASAAAGFVGLLSLFNMVGRFLWSSLSDKIGRKNVYSIYFLLGAVLYCLVPLAGNLGSIIFFVAAFGIIISMLGGTFATIPAYIKDLFGSMQVGAIHGRVLFGWSLAALLGPVLVNYIRYYQIEKAGIAKADAYSITMYIMAGLLVVGFVVNRLIKPVSPKFHYKGKASEGSKTKEKTSK